MSSIEAIIDRVEGHRCYTHPVFDDWAAVNPGPGIVGALFHQIQKFCASTRPGGNFPRALGELGLPEQGALMQEIVESESNHGPELATMAGHIVNRAAGKVVIDDLYDQPAVEAALKKSSDRLLGRLPGYDRRMGLSIQARRAIAVFDRRQRSDAASTYRNIGTALALELISNRHLIPGEKRCLVDSGLYRTTLDDPPMHYLLEHWGEIGAEQQHEKNAIMVVADVLGTHDGEVKALVVEGVDEFLGSLASLWDLLDASLLQSGYAEKTAA
jgi:hypothetical protein